MNLYAWVHPQEPGLVVIVDDDGLFFGFDKRDGRSFSPMCNDIDEAKAWCRRRFAEQN